MDLMSNDIQRAMAQNLNTPNQLMQQVAIEMIKQSQSSQELLVQQLIVNQPTTPKSENSTFEFIV